jgi:hypothetical protein
MTYHKQKFSLVLPCAIYRRRMKVFDPVSTALWETLIVEIITGRKRKNVT